uniref:V-type ATP synthase subunit E n=1 Tax=uncultured Draconibacterium sp. TaxID=1573823 RepID=UPI00321648B6
MSDKIQKLTEKLYDEGIAKAKTEAATIIANAKEEAEIIIKKARQEEEKIINLASEKALEYTEITKAEIKLASIQAINNLKQQIKTLVTTAQVKQPVTNAFKNDEFIRTIILTLIKNWNPQNPEKLDLNVLLPQQNKEDLMEFFRANAIDTLNQGIHIQFDATLTNGFKIGPENGSYLISFTDKDFVDYFKNYLKHPTAELLFSNNSESENKAGE